MGRRTMTFALAVILAGCSSTPVDPTDRLGADVNPPHDRNGRWSAAQVTVGSQHTCLLTKRSEAYCWGLGRDGQLGAPDPPDSSLIPLPVSGGLHFRQLAAGVDFTCGLTTGSEVYCWGSNDEGQLGNGTTISSPVPMRASSDVALRLIAAGRKYSGGDSSVCGIAESGAVYCWGAGFGATPALLSGGHIWTTITMAGTPCGVTTAGETYCWDGSGDPVRVSAVTFVSVSTSRGNTCGVDSTSHAFCWGSNDAGQVGSGPEDAELTVIGSPRALAGGHAFLAVIAAERNACGISVDLRLLCWGSGYGADQSVARSPTAFAAALTFRSLEMSAFHQCGVTAEHDVYCWGANAKGQLGDGTTASRMEPAPVAGPATAVAQPGT